MSDPYRPAETEPHVRCRNLVWEPSPDNGGAVPGHYCVSRVGAVHSMDCPVFQGCACCLFDPRQDDEPPVVVGEERIDEIRAELTVDFLRWSYWKRVDILRGSEPPPEPEEPEAAEEAPEVVEDSPEAESEEVVRHELPPPPPKEEALKEKYPGQRRSEDRRRSRKPATTEETEGGEDDFTRGIFELPSLDPEPETEIPIEEPPPPEPAPGEQPADGKKKQSNSGARRRPRRRSRRRRGGKNGKDPSGSKPST